MEGGRNSEGVRGRVRVGNDDEHMEGENGKRKKRKKANGKERGGDGKRMTRIRNRGRDR